MNIQYLKLSELTPYDNNPKRHSEEQIDAIVQSIHSFGFDQPIVVDADKVIIKGHGRFKAATKLGLKMVPVIVADHLDGPTVKLARLADNDVVSLDWDSAMLKEELEDLLSAGGKLSEACVSEEEFQLLIEAAKKMEVAVSDFTVGNIKTKYDCPKCGYRW